MVIADPVQGGSSDIASCHGSSYPEAQNGYCQAEYIFDWRSLQYLVTGFTLLKKWTKSQYVKTIAMCMLGLSKN